MSAAAGDAGRLLTFEAAGTLYALPISGVLEVADALDVIGIPTLPRERCGVVNWHGDALPVIAPDLLLDPDARAHPAAATARSQEAAEAGSAETASLGGGQLLVISTGSGESACFGLPVDAVVGLVDGPPAHPRSGRVVVEQRPIDGCVVRVVDVKQLVMRAQEVITELVV